MSDGGVSDEVKTLPVHPLIAGLAGANVNLQEALRNAAASSADAARSADRAKEGVPGYVPPEYVNDFGTESQSPEFIVFAGYLGGRAERTPRDYWQVLFLDMRAATWLVVPFNSIQLHSRVEDHKAAFGLRDVIWVKSDTPVGSGDTSSSVTTMFMSGGLSRAADFTSSPQAGTFQRGNGLLQDAITPGCCTGNSRRR